VPTVYIRDHPTRAEKETSMTATPPIVDRETWLAAGRSDLT
jgi:hypothetical protein